MSEPTTNVVQVTEPVESNPETVLPEALVEAELLVEDVSIDGMCGVY